MDSVLKSPIDSKFSGLINEWYLEDLSGNIRMVFDDKWQQGQYIGGFPVYGYRKDPADKNKLVVDEEAAPVVQQIYDWYLVGPAGLADVISDWL